MSVARQAGRRATWLRAGIASAMQKNKRHKNGETWEGDDDGGDGSGRHHDDNDGIYDWGGSSVDEDGWSGGVFEDLTLGQLFNAVSVIQKNSRNYLKYLKARVKELESESESKCES